ncbi:hypothetical protein [Nostoc linckia]|uniref:hypothetical protein n=1 Tax=Nostoc linckia TaxID=92942 RepID=UPI0015D49078|nr:hypothetical protein [Nostoc linckia]
MATPWEKGKGGIFFSSLPFAPCPMPHAQCPMPNAPCPMPHAQCPMPSQQSSINNPI